MPDLAATSKRPAPTPASGHANAIHTSTRGSRNVPRTPAQRICGFGHCLAEVPQDRRRYCSDEHSLMAKHRQTADAAATRARDIEYERIRSGTAAPIPHRGWLTTTDGVVLDGAVVLELRAMSTKHRQALGRLRAHLTTLVLTGNPAAKGLDMTLVEAAGELLSTLDRVLPQPEP